MKNFSGSFREHRLALANRSIFAHVKSSILMTVVYHCFINNDIINALTDRFVKYLIDITNEPLRVEIRIDINRIKTVTTINEICCINRHK